jgi:cytochrome c oxidase cbb3-type subunit I/II
MVAAVTAYGMATLEGPTLAIKSVNSLSHYTDWTIAHVHTGALGWNGLLTFSMLYWLFPRLYNTKLWSTRLANYHFWIAIMGMLFYVVPMYVSGVTQGLMWKQFTQDGFLQYPNFLDASAPRRWRQSLHIWRGADGDQFVSHGQERKICRKPGSPGRPVIP